MPALVNEFSWSFSRDGVWRRCPRQYFFAYHAAWGGWERRADPRTRTMYVLKQLRGRKAWAGECVHEAIRIHLDALRGGGSLLTPADVLEQTLQHMRTAWRDSGEGLYWDDPRKFCALWEHEYDIELPDAEWKATVDHALDCLRTFFASQTFVRLAALPHDAWLQIEKLASFTLDGHKIHLQLDCAHRDEAGGICIYDWKTGRSPSADVSEQLPCYILFAAQQWRVPPERIVAREFNLASNSLREVRLDAEGLAATMARIRQSAAELAAVHGAGEEAYPLATEERVCHTCNFLRVCPRWQGGDETVDPGTDAS